MLEVGTPLTNALEALEKQTDNSEFKKVIRTVHRDIEEGQQLSDAMRRHPKVFSHVFASMIKAGETGGFLKEILDRVVEMQEKRQALISQLRSTLTYPAMLCLVGLGVVIFVLVGVLPKFTTFFAGKEEILPITTRMLMILSNSLRNYWWGYIVVTIGIIVGIKLWKESSPGQLMIDRICVSAPILARLYNKIYTCQLLRTLGHLMVSQVPLLEALRVTRSTIKNRYFIHFIDNITDHVERGGRFSQPFTTYPYILDSVKQMVATGEEVGNLPAVMLRLAAYYDTEVDRELKNIAALIEPIALIFLGGIVGLIVASVILPLFRIAHAIH
jgi:type II secretory pathway component PulF